MPLTLAILNGCESGMLRPETADDYVSLPTGFLYAGAACVISTLWAVNDLSSALLMVKFHELWRADSGKVVRSPAAALREAQRWLREDIRNGGQVADGILPRLLRHVGDPVIRHDCIHAARELARRFPSKPPFVSPVHWAPFVCIGLS